MCTVPLAFISIVVEEIKKYEHPTGPTVACCGIVSVMHLAGLPRQSRLVSIRRDNTRRRTYVLPQALTIIGWLRTRSTRRAGPAPAALRPVTHQRLK